MPIPFTNEISIKCSYNIIKIIFYVWHFFQMLLLWSTLMKFLFNRNTILSINHLNILTFLSHSRFTIWEVWGEIVTCLEREPFERCSSVKLFPKQICKLGPKKKLAYYNLPFSFSFFSIPFQSLQPYSLFFLSSSSNQIRLWAPLAFLPESAALKLLELQLWSW